MDLKKFPKSLNTTAKRILKARTIVEDFLKLKSTAGESASFQGMWSETYIINMEDQSKAVVQFRAEPLDLAPFERARKLIGEYCPLVVLLQDEDLAEAGFFPVYLTYISGHIWCDDSRYDDPEFGPDLNVKVMKSLAKVLALCVIDEKSNNAIRKEVIEKLDKRLQSKSPDVDPYRDIIQDLKRRAETCGLEKLPLFQSHMDLNEMNIMITEEGEVTGIIDWELSPMPQPFGMGLHRIHTLAAVCHQQIFKDREEFDEMDRGLWDEIMNVMPDKHRRVIDENLEAVQVAFTIGTILWCFEYDNGSEYVNPAVLKALPRFLKYRIPALRGDTTAYGDA